VLEELVAERTRELATLLEVSRNVASTLELRPLLGLILDQLKSIVDYSGVGLLSLQGEAYTFLEYRGPLPRERVLGYTSAWYPPELRRQDILHTPTGVIIADLGGETPLGRAMRLAGLADAPAGFEQARGYLGVPLIARAEVVGIRQARRCEPGRPDAGSCRGTAGARSRRRRLRLRARLHVPRSPRPGVDARARGADGRACEVDSAPGRGTRVRVSVPYGD
jgi:GAF domain-containing protein